MKSQVQLTQQRYWKSRVSNLPFLRYSFPPTATLRLQPYLTIPAFTGRQLLTKARLDDLPLNHAHHHKKGNGLCEKCARIARETREHFLLYCPFYNAIRFRFQNRLPKVIAPSLPAATRLTTLFNTPSEKDKPSASDIAHIHAAGAFITEMWQHRVASSGHLYPDLFPRL
jgi:hypothetical protein